MQESFNSNKETREATAVEDVSGEMVVFCPNCGRKNSVKEPGRITCEECNVDMIVGFDDEEEEVA